MNLPILVSPAAEAEADQAATRLEELSPGLAREFFRELDKLLQLLSHYPESCQRFRGPLRRGFLHRFDYAVVYRIHKDAVVIVGVTHCRRHPARLVHR